MPHRKCHLLRDERDLENVKNDYWCDVECLFFNDLPRNHFLRQRRLNNTRQVFEEWVCECVHVRVLEYGCASERIRREKMMSFERKKIKINL